MPSRAWHLSGFADDFLPFSPYASSPYIAWPLHSHFRGHCRANHGNLTHSKVPAHGCGLQATALYLFCTFVGCTIGIDSSYSSKSLRSVAYQRCSSQTASAYTGMQHYDNGMCGAQLEGRAAHHVTVELSASPGTPAARAYVPAPHAIVLTFQPARSCTTCTQATPNSTQH